jgi:hypothetical protein
LLSFTLKMRMIRLQANACMKAFIPRSPRLAWPRSAASCKVFFLNVFQHGSTLQVELIQQSSGFHCDTTWAKKWMQ